MIWIVVALVEDEVGNPLFTHAATCLKQEDAEHLATLIEDAAVWPVKTEEWVAPMYAEIAQPGGES